MKSYLSRIILCTLPVVLAILVIARAYYQYQNGNGGFRLGVDLVGGTILVYEVDPSKPLPSNFKASDLAAALKRRIDPADLYNVTIRPIESSPPRVEIILPTGGLHQVAAEQRKWEELIKAAQEKYPIKGVSEPYTDVPRGKVAVLTAEIVSSRFPAQASKPEPKKIESKKGEEGKKANDKKAEEKKADDKKAGDKKTDEKKTEDKKKAEEEQKKAEEVTRFTKEVSSFINEHWQIGGTDKRQMTGEEIENIKNLISAQGRLEFRILANSTDDGAAIERAIAYLKEPKNATRLNELNILGQPPPPPETADGEKNFSITLHGEPLSTSYAWVELGKQELYTLKLNSAALAQNPQLSAYVDKAMKDHEAFSVSGVTSPLYVRSLKDVMDRVPLRDRELGKTREYFILTRNPQPNMEVTGDMLVSAMEGMGRGSERAVDFSFDNTGATRFGELTTLNKPEGPSDADFHRSLAIVLDGQIQSAPRLNTPITGGRGQITGKFTSREIEDLVTILRAGALPATLRSEPVSQNSMGPTLGADTIAKGTLSVGIAFLAVLIFMIIYYRFAGIVACVALLCNLVLTVAFMVVVSATFTLPGLAGLVLMLGMAVDANVLIYERLREERERGASLALAIRNGYDRAFPTIIDTHLSSIFTAIVLYVVGNDQLKGFGISLTVGLIISLFTSLYMTRTMFEIWLSKGWLKKLSMMHLFHKPNIDFMAIRYYWFTATIILTIAGAGLFVYRMDKGGLNIDFMGGTAYTFQLTGKGMPVAELRERLETNKFVQADLQEATKKAEQLRAEVKAAKKPSQELTGKLAAAEKRVAQLQALEHAPILPDLSIEPIYVAATEAEVADTNWVKFCTIRTLDKDAPQVQENINERLGDALKRIYLSSFKIEKGNKEAILYFSSEPNDPEHQHPDYASPAQVRGILVKEFERINRELEKAQKNPLEYGLDPKQLNIVTPSKKSMEKAEHFSQLTIKLTSSVVNGDELKKALEATQAQFAKFPVPERLENFDQQLAADTQQRALYAILASWGAILLYLWFRFGSWTFGAAAVLCLIHDLFFTLGLIAACHYVAGSGFGNALGLQDFKIDLTSVAALLTLVGYSVNDTIVVFDRIREVRGKNPLLTPQMINDSVNQTLSRTVLSSLTTWLVVFVLYVWGGPGVHLFAFVMVVGVFVGTYSSIYIASPLLLIFGEGAPAKSKAPVPQLTPARG